MPNKRNIKILSSNVVTMRLLARAAKNEQTETEKYNNDYGFVAVAPTTTKPAPKTTKRAAKTSKRVIKSKLAALPALVAPGVDPVALAVSLNQPAPAPSENIGLPAELLRDFVLAPTNAVSKPVASEPEPDANDPFAGLSERQLARLAARKACEAYYSGTSIPFKFRGDIKRLSAVNFVTGNEITHRTAAAIALLLAYCEIRPDYSFVRGSGRMPGSLLGKTGADANVTYNTGIESGALSQLVGGSSNTRRVEYVSGDLHGNGASDAVYRIVPNTCRETLLAFNNKLPDGTGRKLFTSALRNLWAIETAAAESNK